MKTNEEIFEEIIDAIHEKHDPKEHNGESKFDCIYYLDKMKIEGYNPPTTVTVTPDGDYLLIWRMEGFFYIDMEFTGNDLVEYMIVKENENPVHFKFSVFEPISKITVLKEDYELKRYSIWEVL